MRFFGAKQKPGRLAVDLGEDHVTLVHALRGPGQRPRLLRCDSYRIEGELSATLKRLSKGLGLAGIPASVTMAPGEFQWLQIEPPAVPAEEMRAAIRWKIKDMIDFKIDQAGVDVLEIPEDESGYGRNPGVFAVAAPRTALEKYGRLFASADLDLQVIEVPVTALRNVAALFEPEGRGLAFLAFDQHGGVLLFTQGGELFSSRRIDVNLARVTDPRQENRQQTFDRVLLELQRSLDTFEHQFHYVTVTQLAVMPMADEGGLVAFLAENLQLPVRQVDLSEVMDAPTIPEFSDSMVQARALTAIGLALRDAP